MLHECIKCTPSQICIVYNSQRRSVRMKSSSITRSNNSPPLILKRRNRYSRHHVARGEGRDVQFHDETNVRFRFESIVELEKSRMLQRFHDFDFVVCLQSILFFADLNEFRCQKMIRRLLPAFLHFAEFSSAKTTNRRVGRRRRTDRPRNSISSYSSCTDLFFFT